MLYNTNIEIIASEITIDDGESTGMVQDTYTISFSISAEFNGVGTWYLFLKNSNPEFITVPTGQNSSSEDRIIPITSIPLKYDLKLTPGWEIYSRPCFFVTEPEDDRTDLSSQISTSVFNLIKMTMKSGMTLNDTMVRFECFKDTRRLKIGEGFDIDIKEDPGKPDGMRIDVVVHDCTPHITYRLFILVNNFVVNNIAAEVTEFNKET